MQERLRRGDILPGFGHPLYRDGDPRAKLLFELLDEHYPRSKDLAFAREFAALGEEVLGEKPTVDFALVALVHTLKLPEGSALTLFSIGRSIGWIGHAIEQYQTGATIRPRAKYVGRMPE